MKLEEMPSLCSRCKHTNQHGRCAKQGNNNPVIRKYWCKDFEPRNIIDKLRALGYKPIGK